MFFSLYGRISLILKYWPPYREHPVLCFYYWETVWNASSLLHWTKSYLPLWRLVCLSNISIASSIWNWMNTSKISYTIEFSNGNKKLCHFIYLWIMFQSEFYLYDTCQLCMRKICVKSAKTIEIGELSSFLSICSTFLSQSIYWSCNSFLVVLDIFWTILRVPVSRFSNFPRTFPIITEQNGPIRFLSIDILWWLLKLPQI